ncbi:hypothetical protein [Fodinicola feengrottensis]|uniref:Uncharacterized protein n=1 Tax=Fodinicola feengrottensis TaxID=435914 RepID=A0ABN2IXK2_9ACTN|nr:hypothetical protein [Fodinicola feengrottensis]
MSWPPTVPFWQVTQRMGFQPVPADLAEFSRWAGYLWYGPPDPSGQWPGVVVKSDEWRGTVDGAGVSVIQLAQLKGYHRSYTLLDSALNAGHTELFLGVRVSLRHSAGTGKLVANRLFPVPIVPPPTIVEHFSVLTSEIPLLELFADLGVQNVLSNLLDTWISVYYETLVVHMPDFNDPRVEQRLHTVVALAAAIDAYLDRQAPA